MWNNKIKTRKNLHEKSNEVIETIKVKSAELLSINQEIENKVQSKKEQMERLEVECNELQDRQTENAKIAQQFA